jgi:hypothetical protein
MHACDRCALAVFLVAEPDPVHERLGHAAILIVIESDDVTHVDCRVVKDGLGDRLPQLGSGRNRRVEQNNRR